MRSKTIGSATAANNTGSATADYTSIADWEDSIADTDDETGTAITKVAALQTAGIALLAVPTSGRQYLLTADSSTYVNAATHEAATSRARIDVSSGYAIGVFDLGWTVEKIAIHNSDSGNNAFISDGSYASGAFTTYFRRCVVAGAAGHVVSWNAYVTLIASNIASYGSGGAYVCGSSSTLTLYNCSGCQLAGYTFVHSSGTATANGCISGGGANDNFYGTWGGNYNVSRDASAPGANSLLSQIEPFIETLAGYEDLRPNGRVDVRIVNRSGYPSDTDTGIDGTARASTSAPAGCCGTYWTERAPHNMTATNSPSPYVAADSDHYSGFDGYLAFDDQYNNLHFWASASNPYGWVSIDMGSGNAWIAYQYGIRHSSVSEPNRAPMDWTFEGSNDNSNWTVLHTVTGETSWANVERRTFNPTDISTAYRYFRVNVSDNNGDAIVALGEVFIQGEAAAATGNPWFYYAQQG